MIEMLHLRAKIRVYLTPDPKPYNLKDNHAHTFLYSLYPNLPYHG